MTALDRGSQSKQIRADLLIDSGVYRTLLMEEQWKQIQPEGANRMQKLKKSSQISAIWNKQNPGNARKIKMPAQGRSRSRNNYHGICDPRSEGVIIGVEGWRGPGIIKIKPEGDTVRKLDI